MRHLHVFGDLKKGKDFKIEGIQLNATGSFNILADVHLISVLYSNTESPKIYFLDEKLEVYIVRVRKKNDSSHEKYISMIRRLTMRATK